MPAGFNAVTRCCPLWHVAGCPLPAAFTAAVLARVLTNLPPSPPLPPQAELLIVWTLLITILTVSYVIQRKKFRALPPSSSAMLLGILAGDAAPLAADSEIAPSSCAHEALSPSSCAHEGMDRIAARKCLCLCPGAALRLLATSSCSLHLTHAGIVTRIAGLAQPLRFS